jgi:hypothetical protein
VFLAKYLLMFQRSILSTSSGSRQFKNKSHSKKKSHFRWAKQYKFHCLVIIILKMKMAAFWIFSWVVVLTVYSKTSLIRSAGDQ